MSGTMYFPLPPLHTVHEITAFTPNYLWYGRELRHTVGKLVLNPREVGDVTYPEYVKKLKDKIAFAYDKVRRNLKRSSLTTKKYYDLICDTLIIENANR